MCSLSPRLILFCGVPGTGKSTLAEAVGKRLGVPVFAFDWLLGALQPHGVLELGRTAQIADSVLLMLARRQIRLSQSAIIDCLLTMDVYRAPWRALTSELNIPAYWIRTVCTNVAIHRERIEARVRNIPGWYEVTWEHVERIQAREELMLDQHLLVDAMEPLQDNINLVLQYVGHSEAIQYDRP